MPTTEEIKDVREFRNVSLGRAVQILTRREFCQELRTDETISDVVDTLIRILEFEFGDDYDS